jgi:hypothetical protein
MAQIDPVAEAIAEADHAEAETTYRLNLARDMYQLGQQAGYDAGRRAAEADEAAAWRQLHNDMRGLASSPSHAELQEQRWGPGGREHFADPRPGDFPGRGAQPEPEPALPGGFLESGIEAEAG